MKIINLFFVMFFLFSITPTFSMEGGERFEYEKNFKFNPKNQDAEALCSLGMNHKYGWGGVTKDIKESINCYQKAADQGYAPAQYELGLIYACGTDVNQDDVESVKWYRLAAAQGHDKAKRTMEYRDKQLVHEEKMSLLHEKRRRMNAENVILLETSAAVGGCCNIF